jgi:acyl carrier protein
MLGIEDDAFSESLSYQSVPEWDSERHIDIVLEIEQRFGVEFDADEIVSMTSITRIYVALAEKGVVLA